jgi:hypothetical protein
MLLPSKLQKCLSLQKLSRHHHPPRRDIIQSFTTRKKLVVGTGCSSGVTSYQDAIIQIVDPLIVKSETSMPRVRCGAPLHVNVTLPKSYQLIKSNVESMELAFKWKQKTLFYKMESYTAGSGKNQRTETRIVTYRGSKTMIPTKRVLWSDKDEDEDHVKDVFLDIPLGMAPSYKLKQEPSLFELSKQGSSSHSLLLQAIMKPTEMTTFDRLCQFDFGFVFGFGSEKNVIKYNAPEVQIVR